MDEQPVLRYAAGSIRPWAGSNSQLSPETRAEEARTIITGFLELPQVIQSRGVFNLNTIRTNWQRKLLHDWFIKVIGNHMCSNFRWPDRIQFEYYSG